jgi:hypothetical protein
MLLFGDHWRHPRQWDSGADSVGEGFRDLTIGRLPRMASTRHQLRTRPLPHLPADAQPVPAEDPRHGRIVDAALRLVAAHGGDEHRLRPSPAADADVARIGALAAAIRSWQTTAGDFARNDRPEARSTSTGPQSSVIGR